MGMISLSSVTDQNQEGRGKLITIHADGGVGKSLLAAEVCIKHDGLMVLGEEGLSTLGMEGVKRTPVLGDWGDVKNLVKELVTTNHNYKTVAFDTVDNLTTLLDSYVVEHYYGGDSKAADSYKSKYSEMKTEFNGFLDGIDMLLDKGINVMALVHSVIDTHRSPDTEAYQYWALDLPGGVKTSLSNLLFNHSDIVMFGRYDVMVTDNRGVGGQRVLMTKSTPAWAAKSRIGSLADKIPMSYDAIKGIL